MSMFSIHYLIRRKSGGYWNGGPPIEESSWSNASGIGIHAKKDAEEVVKRLMLGIETVIEEEE
jgi:hypothetical protein